MYVWMYYAKCKVLKSEIENTFTLDSVLVFFKGILSYFGQGQNYRKPKNSRGLRQKNTEQITTNHKGTRKVKDGKDQHGLQKTNLKKLG